MKVPICLLLLTSIAWGQPPPQGPPSPSPDPNQPSGTSSPGTLPDTNPWHELLHRMMELMQTAAGVSPGPNTGANQNQGKQQPQQGQTQQQNQNQPSNQGQGRMQGQDQWGRGGGMGGPPTTVPPPPPQPTTQPRPIIQDCFWEGKYYRPGTDIVRGQHDRWCYVTYCDSQGNIQFWDDYNCPPNSMKPTSGHSAGRPGGGPPTPQPPTAPPSVGCNFEGRYYDVNQEISSHKVGDRCYGTYCSHDSQVIQWDDWCAAPSTSPEPPPAGAHPPILGTNQAPPPGGPRQGQGPSQGQGPRGGGPKAGPPPQKAGPPPKAAAPGQQGQGGRRGRPVQGCYHNNLYYKPNEDVIVGNIGDMCYGYYCEGDNVFVHWEDLCGHQHQPAPAPTTQATSGFGTGGGASSGFFFK